MGSLQPRSHSLPDSKKQLVAGLCLCKPAGIAARGCNHFERLNVQMQVCSSGVVFRSSLLPLELKGL